MEFGLSPQDFGVRGHRSPAVVFVSGLGSRHVVLAVSEVALVCAAGVVVFEVFADFEACEYGYGMHVHMHA